MLENNTPSDEFKVPPGLWEDFETKLNEAVEQRVFRGEQMSLWYSHPLKIRYGHVLSDAAIVFNSIQQTDTAASFSVHVTLPSVTIAPDGTRKQYDECSVAPFDFVYPLPAKNQKKPGCAIQILITGISAIVATLGLGAIPKLSPSGNQAKEMREKEAEDHSWKQRSSVPIRTENRSEMQEFTTLPAFRGLPYLSEDPFERSQPTSDTAP